jgi:hypothetical protein
VRVKDGLAFLFHFPKPLFHLIERLSDYLPTTGFLRSLLAAVRFIVTDYNTLAGFGRIRAMQCGIARGVSGFLQFPHAQAALFRLSRKGK